MACQYDRHQRPYGVTAFLALQATSVRVVRMAPAQLARSPPL